MKRHSMLLLCLICTFTINAYSDYIMEHTNVPIVANVDSFFASLTNIFYTQTIDDELCKPFYKGNTCISCVMDNVGIIYCCKETYFGASKLLMHIDKYNVFRQGIVNSNVLSFEYYNPTPTLPAIREGAN